MQVRLLPAPFGRSNAADEKSPRNHMLNRRTHGASWRLSAILTGLLSVIAAALPQTSLAAVQVSALTCASSSFTGTGTESCTVTLSGPVSRSTSINVLSTSTLVRVPSAVPIQAGQSSVQFTAPVASVKSTQVVTIAAIYNWASYKAFTMTLSPPASSSPGMTVSATSLSFGTVGLNTLVSKSVTITSSGKAALTLNSITASGTGFAVSGGSFPMTLNPGQTAALTISFDPTTVGNFTGSVAISSNAATATISLSGSGQAPATLSALSCSSGSLTGAGTDACTVSLTSAATSATTVTLSSSSTAVTVPASVTIASGATSAGFTATATAVSSNQAATLTATAAGVSKAFNLALNASTPGLTLSSSSVAFGTDALNTTITKTVTLTSSGSAALTINAASVTGTGFGNSGMTFPVTLNPGQAATLTISFNPTTAGNFTGSVAISSNAATATISLSGTGQAPATLSALSCSKGSLTGAGTDACTVSLTSAATSATTVALSSSSSAVTVPASVTIASGATSAGFTATATAVSTNQTATLTAMAAGVSKTFAITLNASTPGLTLSSSSVAFGTDALNTTITKTVTLTSSGSAALTINAATVTGTGFGDSGITFPVTLNPTQTATLTISFNPTTAGNFTGSVTISSNAAAATISLNGTGQAPATLSALSCSKGSLTGAGTDACTVSLTSAATAATVVTLTSSSSAVTVPASVTIASGATSAGFTATATAVSTSQTATLTATAGGVAKTFAITLNATTPSLTLSSTSVAFGSVQLNTPATQSVMMTSSGTGAVTLSAGSVAGAGFSMPGSKFPVTLNPGQTATLNLQFNPSTAGAATGTVSLSSNCSMGAMNVALSGTGTAASTYQVDLSWNAPASSADPVVGYHIYRATGSGTYALLNSSINQPSSFSDTTVKSGSTYNYEVTSVDAAGVESAPSNVYIAAIP